MMNCTETTNLKVMNTDSLFGIDDCNYNSSLRTQTITNKPNSPVESISQLIESSSTSKSNYIVDKVTTKRRSDGSPVTLNQHSRSPPLSLPSLPSSASNSPGGPCISTAGLQLTSNQVTKRKNSPGTTVISSSPLPELTRSQNYQDKVTGYLDNNSKDQHLFDTLYRPPCGRSESGYSSGSSKMTVESKQSNIVTDGPISLTPWTDKLQTYGPLQRSPPNLSQLPFTHSSSFLNSTSTSVTHPNKTVTNITFSQISTCSISSNSKPTDLAYSNVKTFSNNLNNENPSHLKSSPPPVTAINSENKSVPENLSHLSKPQTMKELPTKEQRFKRTSDVLQKCGLWGVAMKTGDLIKRNKALQKELDHFKAEAINFLRSIVKDPSNRGIVKKALHGALKSNSGKPRTVIDTVVSAAIKLDVEGKLGKLKEQDSEPIMSNIASCESMGLNMDSVNYQEEITRADSDSITKDSDYVSLNSKTNILTDCGHSSDTSLDSFKSYGPEQSTVLPIGGISVSEV